MTVVGLILFAVALAVMVTVHVKLERDSIRRDEQRQHTLYKQHKSLTRQVASVVRVTAKMVDETRGVSAHLKEDARLLHERADTLLREARDER